MTELEIELLTLLDLIEVNDDASLASNRFEIVEKHGYAFVPGIETSDIPS